MPSLPVRRFRQMHQGKPIDLYLTAVPAAEIINRCAVDIQSTDNPKGYQRRPEPSRSAQIARYVLRQEGMLPTALLANIRSGAAFQEISPGTNLGQLHYTETESWYLEDGQNRMLGVKEAMRQAADARKPVDLGYDLPIVFSIGLSRTDEMELFRIVNSKAKNVPTDLLASITFNRVTDNGSGVKPTLPQIRKAAGVAVSHYLGANDPWKGHIQAVNEPKDVVNKPMQANTIASTLMPVMRERWVHARFLTNPNDREYNGLSRVVLSYWRALANLMPEAFADISKYNVQRPIGVYAFHELLPEIMDACRTEQDWSVESFTTQLKRLAEWVDSLTWHRVDGEDIVKGGGNRAAIRHVVERMRVLYHDPLTGLLD